MSDNKKPQNDDINLDELVNDIEQKVKAEEEGQAAGATATVSRDEELEQYKDQALRAMAELQNAKRRMEEERKDFVRFASARLLEKLIPVMDNFERAFANLPEDLKNNEWVKGVSQIEKSFIEVLNKEGLEEIDSDAGDDFNANFHEAVMQDANVEEGKIAVCLEKGYELKGKVLRVSKVSVGSK